MSVSTEVQRTLVKSPPELWSELSNPDSLARHLAELGEIRITSVEPETKVEWEAEDATGVVHLKQSGWGTKVTLSVTRNPPLPEAEPEPIADMASDPPGESDLEPEPAVVEAAPQSESVSRAEPVSEDPAENPEFEAAAIEPTAETTAETETEPVADIESKPVELGPEPVELGPNAEPEPQRGFFARLFRRRKTRLAETVEAEPEPEPPVPVAATETELTPTLEAIAESEPAPVYEALAAPEPIYLPSPTKAAVDLAAELAAVEAQMTEETTELLTGVLDRLGAAHHRPFSRG
jgi:hypothetical protein